MKINVKAFAFTASLLWGFGLLFITWWLILFEGESGNITMIGRIYRGYNISLTGSLIGVLWGLFDGLIGGAIFAWLYNFISSRLNSGKQA